MVGYFVVCNDEQFTLPISTVDVDMKQAYSVNDNDNNKVYPYAKTYDSIEAVARHIVRQVLKTVTRNSTSSAYNAVNQLWTMRNDSMRYRPTTMDVEDLHQSCALALWEHIDAMTIDVRQWLGYGYNVVNHIVYDEKSKSSKTISMEDVLGEIIPINKQINRLLTGNNYAQTYIPYEGDRVHQVQSAYFVNALYKRLTNTQKRIYKARANSIGASGRQLASDLHIDAKTYREHVSRIECKALELLELNQDRFNTLIDAHLLETLARDTKEFRARQAAKDAKKRAKKASKPI